MSSPYFVDMNRMIKRTKEGDIQLTNFLAEIVEEHVYHDGDEQTTHLLIRGSLEEEAIAEAEELNRSTNCEKPSKPSKRLLPDVMIQATDLSSFAWIAQKWGTRPIIFPVASAERDIRTIIQLYSRPIRRHTYTATGWAILESGERAFVTQTGAITATGFDDSISVALPNELRAYSLDKPTKDANAFLESLRIVNIGPKDIMWPLLLAAYRAPIGEADFALHLAGRTGTFKSEVTGLIQSHFGRGMDARHLPGSWSSTANAIEALAYRAKDAIFVLDDFIPTGTAYQIRNLQAMADKIIRAAANQAGRSRLTDAANLKVQNFPRSLILSTGEDIPEGHSVRGRMLIVELAPDDIEPPKLSAAQKSRPMYSKAMADWIQWLAQRKNLLTEFRDASNMYRDQFLGTGHPRHPSTLGQLMATADLLNLFATERKYLTQEQAEDVTKKAKEAIAVAGAKQIDYLETVDPVNAFLNTLRDMMATNLAHVKTRSGGIPANAEQFGWTREESPGSMATYKSHGPRLGWVDLEDGLLMIDPSTFNIIKKYSGGKITITNQTLWKRLKESGVLTQVEEDRQRNTVRVTLEGVNRSVLMINLDEVLDEPSKPSKD